MVCLVFRDIGKNIRRRSNFSRGPNPDADSQLLEFRVINLTCDSELKFVSYDQTNPNRPSRRSTLLKPTLTMRRNIIKC